VTRTDLSLEAIIRGRRTVRRYTERPVARELIEQILEAARWAPSPHGRMPWRFAVLTRAEPKLRLAEAMGDEWRPQLAFDGQDQATIEVRRRKSHERIVGAPDLIVEIASPGTAGYDRREKQDAYARGCASTGSPTHRRGRSRCWRSKAPSTARAASFGGAPRSLR